MNYKMIGRFIAQILTLEAVFMMPALFISMYHSEYDSVSGFSYSMIITAVLALILFLMTRGTEKRGFYAREGLVCVGISWIVLSLIGSLPFMISGVLPDFIDALFESTSGFSTTGSSAISDVESAPMGILYWRSFSQWIGGMGVLVFLLAISPRTGRNKKADGFMMHLLRAESPGPDVGKLAPKLQTTAIILYLMYVLLTVMDIILLIAGGMSLFEAVCAGFSTASTGGMGVKNDSFAGYGAFVHYVTTVFMILFGVNFTCYYLAFTGHIKQVLKDEEIRFYFILVVLSIAVVTFSVRGVYGSGEEAFRLASFQTISLMSSTGFTTTDYDSWNSLPKVIMLSLTIIGSCAGSTGGGLKCTRVLILIKTLRRNIHNIITPQRVQVVRINGRSVDEKIVANISSYFAAYMLILLFSFLIIAHDAPGMETDLSAVLLCLNNVGAGFYGVGPGTDYSCFDWISKLVLVFDMLVGRLEIFPILLLFSRSTWRRN